MDLLREGLDYLYIFVLIISIILNFRINLIETNFVILYFESCIIVAIIAKYFARIYSHNFIVFQYSDIILYSILILLFYIEIVNKKIKNLILLIIPLYIISILITNNIIGQLEYPSLMEAVGSIIIFVLALYYYYELFTTERIQNLSQDGMFWILSSFFLYFSGTFFLNLTFDKIVSGKISAYFDNLNIILTYVYCIVTIIGIYLIYKSKKSVLLE